MIEFVPQQWGNVELARARAQTRIEIASCTACPLHETSTPTPFIGPGRPRFAVVTDTPLQDRPRKLFRALLSEVGVDENEVFWCAVASCVTNGTPPINARQKCRRHLIGQMVVSNTPYVLLVGATALDAWRGDLKIDEHHGIVGVMGGTWIVMPVHHPATALLHNQSLKEVIRRDLKVWSAVIDMSPELVLTAGLKACVICNGHAEHHDSDGVGYCVRHWQSNMRQWERERARWPLETNEQLELI